MITKTDCMAILVGLEDKGININIPMRKLMISKDVPLDVLQFIAKNQGMEAVNFYEMLRVKHNKNKSPLYTNIVRETSAEDKIMTTLTALLMQILLYSNKLDNKETFLKEVRAEEISRVINNYFATGEIERCSALLKLIKTDLMVLEYINGRRELNN